MGARLQLGICAAGLGRSARHAQHRGRQGRQSPPFRAVPTAAAAMEKYEIVRRVTSKGAFGEIFVVKHKHEGAGGNQYVLKRARLTKMSEQDSQPMCHQAGCSYLHVVRLLPWSVVSPVYQVYTVYYCTVELIVRPIVCSWGHFQKRRLGNNPQNNSYICVFNPILQYEL